MLLAAIGFFAGIVGGMGIGGGTILIPALIFLAGTNQQVAQSVSLLSFVPVAITALIVHLYKKNIQLKLVFKMFFQSMAGAVLGAYLAVNLDPVLLKKAFGCFLFVMGLREITAKIKHKEDKKT